MWWALGIRFDLFQDPLWILDAADNKIMEGAQVCCYLLVRVVDSKSVPLTVAPGSCYSVSAKQGQLGTAAKQVFLPSVGSLYIFFFILAWTLSRKWFYLTPSGVAFLQEENQTSGNICKNWRVRLVQMGLPRLACKLWGDFGGCS